MNYYQIETKLGYHHPLKKICITRYEETKSAEDRKRCGRSKILTARNDLVLLRTVRKIDAGHLVSLLKHRNYQME